VLSEILTFIFFVLIGLEIREGLSKPREAILPAISALGGMIFPALIFLALIPHSSAWAVAMPTDVALAIGALSLLGKRVNPAVRLYLLTLAVADDFLSLIAIGIFFTDDLHISSALYTLGAAALGFILPMRSRLITMLSPIATFVIIPLYIFINLLTKLDFSFATEQISIAVVVARVLGKVIGITLFTYLALRFTHLGLPHRLNLKEVTGIGFLAGMGLTVSLVIADITLHKDSQLAQVRIGLFLSALLSGLTGLLWLKYLARSSSSDGQL
jgi:NhaA family Na+:H+ antiporter